MSAGLFGASVSEPPLSKSTMAAIYIYLFIYIYPSDLLAPGWPRATRKRKVSPLAHAHAWCLLKESRVHPFVKLKGGSSVCLKVSVS